MKKYYRITEVVKIVGVDRRLVLRLEEEGLIVPVVRKREKLYPLDALDRVRVARMLIEELGLNFEGVEVVLPMRARMIEMQRAMLRLARRMREEG